MKLKILSFGGEAFSSENVVSATMMTGIGEITALDNHAPLLTSIKPSTMYVVYIDDKDIERRDDFAIGTGVVEISNNSVKIMADMLVDIDDLDVSKAERAREEALKLMEKYRDSKDKMDMEKFIEAEDMLLRSIAQLKLGSTIK
ncbi:ATP synthase F1 subunit epsilon [Candidatus Gracilibacteria bacterium 28_42_T64]|nr:ATP synthase F1 subunit epsilon [Candidatus Gracilibacteria bacterium 28_42_T64]